MLTTLNPRLVFLGIAAVAAISMAFAYYLEHQLELAPCPLCMTQRAFVVLTGVIALLGALHNPAGWGRRLYGGLCTLAAITGGAVAAPRANSWATSSRSSSGTDL